MRLTVLLLFLLACLVRPLAANEPVTISVGEYPPYESESLEGFGLVPRLITAAFAESGRQVEYRFFPWARAYVMSKQGKVDATAHWFSSEERARDHFYSEPILTETTIWVHLRDRPVAWQGLEDLSGLRLGAVIGYTYTAEFLDLSARGMLDVQFVPDDVLNYRKLLNGRIDMFPEGIYSADYLIRTNFPKQANRFVFHPKPFFASDLFLLFSRKGARAETLLEEFNRGLEIIREKGIYRTIVRPHEGDEQR